MREYPDNHGGLFDACPEPVEGAAMIFRSPPQYGQCWLSMEGSLSGGTENPEGAYCGCLSAGLIFGMLAAKIIVA